VHAAIRDLSRSSQSPGRWILCLALIFIGAFVSACRDPSPPPRWQEGGARLVLGDAKWFTEGGTIEVLARGYVLFSGRLVFVIDRVGRVVDADYAPVALLMPDGELIGTDSTDLGRIGLRNGAPPDQETAWFTIKEDGEVTFFDRSGERLDAGHWTGCDERMLRTCTLVSHLAFLRAARRQRPMGPGYGPGMMGPGMGIGVWRWR
jgi:hypothetical protein